MIHLFMNDSPLRERFTFSCMIHLIMHVSPFNVWFTYSCMIHLLMWISPFPEWFTFWCTIHLFMNDSPFHECFTWIMIWFYFCWTTHLWFIYDSSFFAQPLTFSFIIHLPMQFILLMHESPLHVWFTLKVNYIKSMNHLLSCMFRLLKGESYISSRKDES